MQKQGSLTLTKDPRSHKTETCVFFEWLRHFGKVVRVFRTAFIAPEIVGSRIQPIISNKGNLGHATAQGARMGEIRRIAFTKGLRVQALQATLIGSTGDTCPDPKVSQC